ncbi:hypothetical protein [Roseateles noduli]|uniref:hypothetical protein n=1 Tax=Roseateles noduli TaxID=2052484 RepID=UPI003D649CCA
MDSADLLAREAYFTLAAQGVTIHINADKVLRRYWNFRPRILNVGLVCESECVIVQQRLTDYELESFELGAQGMLGGSGINYNPYRIWTDAELSAAATLQTPECPSEIFCELHFGPVPMC